MQPFSQKIVAAANILVLTCLFIFCLHWNNTKNREESQIWYNSTQNPKNALDKIIGTLNLIFGSTPWEKK